MPARVAKLDRDFVEGVPPPRSADWQSEYDARFRSNGLSRNQVDYLRDADSNPRGRRKDSR